MPQFTNHFNDLRLLQPEDDLIQIHSRPQSPQPGENTDIGAGRSSKERSIQDDTRNARQRSEFQPKFLQAQTSLLDLDDPSPAPEKDKVHKEKSRARSISGDGLIRRDSRETFTSSVRAPSASRKNSLNELCDSCEEYGAGRDYCNVCDHVFCQKCWKQQMTHKSQKYAPGSIPHEKTNQRTARKIQNALDAGKDVKEQEVLHGKDENTTWFGITWGSQDDAALPILQDHGRYAAVMDSSRSRASEFNADWDLSLQDGRYPSLVSFVGQTGAGKSTIIKLVIDLISREGESFPTPVVGSNDTDLPTSGDCHLYSDPQSSLSKHPILYADCEGLDGGEREPLGASSRKRNKAKNLGRVNSFEKKLQRVFHTLERDITWANTPLKRTRAFAVSQMYPRLLYTFSDVVVYVLRDAQTIEVVFEKLVEWAAAALEKSSNQPALPHAIVVLNASQYDIREDSWDVQSATRSLLENVSKTVYQNVIFKKRAQFWRDRDREIETVEQLLYSYYASVNIVRIPTRGRPNLIRNQIIKLYSHIKLACDISRERKAELRMLLDADELNPYLQFAFEHFAKDLDSPFDFVQASFIHSPIPLDFGGNILKLAINLMEVWENELNGDSIFRELSYMVASCIMLESARCKIRGTAAQIFPRYLEHLEAALENFCDRHWPCEFVKSGGGARCVNVRSGHGSKGHQLKNGKVFAVGSYVSEFSFASYRDIFIGNVYHRFDELLKSLRQTLLGQNGMEETQVAADIHKDTIMVHFFNHSAKGRAGAFISHSTCFSCLFEQPEHALPCGHILCTTCLQAYGHVNKSGSCVELDGCPLESLYRPPYGLWRILLKPAPAGIRVLNLDGGGMRGIVELEILRQIEQALGGRLPIQSFFDLIVGTSTGGLIALGLAAKNWSVDECTHQFEILCSQAFTKRVFSNMPVAGWLVNTYNHSKYETRPFQEALKKAFSESEYLFGGPRPHTLGTDIKVAVTATSSSGDPVVFANYNRLCSEKLPYQFQRPERASSELKIWEAARATSAAPRFFKPFHHDPSKQIYMDGAIYHNNPVQIADPERKLLWPAMAKDYPDLFVSLGTCYNPNSHSSTEDIASSQVGFWSYGKSLVKIASNHVMSSLDSERAWHAYMNVLSPPSNQRLKYYRINPQLDEAPPSLDQWEHMSKIRELTRSMMLNESRIQRLASHLIASSFYFEVTRVRAESLGSVAVRGYIFCRLISDSREIRELGKLLMNKLASNSQIYFVVQEEHNGRKAEHIQITSELLSKMITRGHFQIEHWIRLTSKVVNTEILLSLGRDGTYPISRFPRSLLEDQEILPRVRHQTRINPKRWAARTASQQLRRHDWKAPDLSPDLTSPKLPKYSSNNYTIGDSSPNKLKVMAKRLFIGTSPTTASTTQADQEMENIRRRRFSLANAEFSKTVHMLELPSELPGDSTWSPGDRELNAEIPDYPIELDACPPPKRKSSNESIESSFRGTVSTSSFDVETLDLSST